MQSSPVGLFMDSFDHIGFVWFVDAFLAAIECGIGDLGCICESVNMSIEM